MKGILAGAWILTLAASFALGYVSAPREAATRPAPDPTLDAVESLSAALDDQDLLTRTFRFAEALQGLRAENLEPSLAVFDQKRAGTSQHEARVFMFAWSRFDPAGAFAWASAHPTGWRETLEGAALYAWAFRDAQGALQEFEKLSEARQKELRWHLVEGWARSEDKQGVTEYVMDLPPSRARGGFIKMVVEKLRKDGMDAVLEWAEAVPESAPNDGKLFAVQSALAVVAKWEIDTARRWFERNLELEQAQPTIKVLATSWVDFHDPPGLFDWLVRLPSAELRADGVRAGFVRWLRIDPDAARSWLRGSTLTEAFDPAVAVYARDLSRTSPAEAVQWAERITDETARRQTLVPILRQWAREDHRAVREWLADSDVPAEVRDAILNSPAIRVREAREAEAGAGRVDPSRQ